MCLFNEVRIDSYMDNNDMKYVIILYPRNISPVKKCTFSEIYGFFFRCIKPFLCYSNLLTL